jgi:(p)ppGpp synthase/HD superfamily hydrolase
VGTGSDTGIPAFARRSARLTEAYRFARDAHEGSRRSGSTTIDHPAEVARLLHDVGYPEHVVVAALLHDVVEDTTTDVSEVAHRFGSQVASLVAQLTEDPGIPGYDERKGELRRRATTDGHHAASIFAADKLASAQALNARREVPARERLEHFQRTERLLRAAHPEVPFLDPLAEEIGRLRDRATATLRS